jgi:hypothetical protein
MLMMGAGSIWILIGIFNPEQMPLGLNCSRVVKANSAFVSEIQVPKAVALFCRAHHLF